MPDPVGPGGHFLQEISGCRTFILFLDGASVIQCTSQKPTIVRADQEPLSLPVEIVAVVDHGDPEMLGDQNRRQGEGEEDEAEEKEFGGHGETTRHA